MDSNKRVYLILDRKTLNNSEWVACVSGIISKRNELFDVNENLSENSQKLLNKHIETICRRLNHSDWVNDLMNDGYKSKKRHTCPDNFSVLSDAVKNIIKSGREPIIAFTDQLDTVNFDKKCVSPLYYRGLREVTIDKVPSTNLSHDDSLSTNQKATADDIKKYTANTVKENEYLVIVNRPQNEMEEFSNYFKNNLVSVPNTGISNGMLDKVTPEIQQEMNI